MTFEELIALLPERRRPDIDLRNHGESGDTPNGPTFGVDEAADVSAAIDYIAPSAGIALRRARLLAKRTGHCRGLFLKLAAPRPHAPQACKPLSHLLR